MTEPGRFDTVRTDRLLMRRWLDSDREPFAALNADPAAMLFFPQTLDREASDRLVDLIEERFDQQGYGLWALEVAGTGEFIGFTGLAAEQSELTDLTREYVGRVGDAISLSRATLRVIRQNLAWAFGYNLVLVPLAMLDVIPPALAALAMACSSVTVVGNALRLRRWRPGTGSGRGSGRPESPRTVVA